jgi:hypothetical protein
LKYVECGIKSATVSHPALFSHPLSSLLLFPSSLTYIAMVNFTIFAGGYDVFIAAYLFNSDAKTLSLSAKYSSGGNPSWISLHPTDKSIL